jgi:hypothetical protein
LTIYIYFLNIYIFFLFFLYVVCCVSLESSFSACFDVLSECRKRVSSVATHSFFFFVFIIICMLYIYNKNQPSYVKMGIIVEQKESTAKRQHKWSSVSDTACVLIMNFDEFSSHPSFVYILHLLFFFSLSLSLSLTHSLYIDQLKFLRLILAKIVLFDETPKC